MEITPWKSLVPDPGCNWCRSTTRTRMRGSSPIRTGPCVSEELFPGVDPHEITGRAVWGDDEYEAHMPDGWETDKGTQAQPLPPEGQGALARLELRRWGERTTLKASGNRSTWRSTSSRRWRRPTVGCAMASGLRGSGDNGYIYNA